MEIGEALRTVLVEPLEVPVNEPQKRPEPTASLPDPDTEPVKK